MGKMKLVLASGLLLAATAAVLTEGTRRLLAEPPAAPAQAPASTAAAPPVPDAAPAVSGPGSDVRVVYPSPWAVTTVPRQAGAEARPVGPPPPETGPLRTALGQANGTRYVKTITVGPPGTQPPGSPQPTVAQMPQPAAPAARPVTPMIALAPSPADDVQVLAKEFDAPPAPPPAREPRTGRGLVDLNTASLAELDGLGAGKVGRAIVRGRPYADAEDLVTRRVLKRSTYESIKSRIEVR